LGVSFRHIVLPVAFAFGSSATPAVAQTGGGLVIEVLELRNYVGFAIGALPDYMGSDDYTIGIAPAGKIRFGDGER
jgi:hypothetical protein